MHIWIIKEKWKKKIKKNQSFISESQMGWETPSFIPDLLERTLCLIEPIGYELCQKEFIFSCYSFSGKLKNNSYIVRLL
jgi:hypothetical protein